jgi:hypothetical protein
MFDDIDCGRYGQRANISQSILAALSFHVHSYSSRVLREVLHFAAAKLTVQVLLLHVSHSCHTMSQRTVVLFNHQYRRRKLMSHFPSLYLRRSLCMRLGYVGEEGEDHYCTGLYVSN